MSMMKEIKNYEGLYSITDKGEVIRYYKNGNTRTLKPQRTKKGYYIVVLSKHNIQKSFNLHSLVWQHFSNKNSDGHILEIDHKNGKKENNSIDNLQLLTTRENVSKSKKNKYSKYTGVYPRVGGWMSQIHIDGVLKYLGYFKTEYDAHLAYEKELERV